MVVADTLSSPVDIVQHSTWQTTRKGNRVYWTALWGALGRELHDENGRLCTFPTRKAAVAALIAHEPGAKPSATV